MPAFFAGASGARRAPLEVSLAIAAVAVSVYVVVAPLTASRYVPMIDLPFHAAQGSTFLHYWDPSYHLREQFELHPLASPYMSMYALVAALMIALPMIAAVKIAVAIHLLLLPAGLAVFFHGAKKSPLLGLLGLGLCWGSLTHWGFLNYVGSLGLFCMIVGLTLLVLDRPARGRRAALAIALVAIFFTHIFRYPFAVAAVIGTAVVMLPATKRFRPILLPLVPSLVLFAIWWHVRPAALSGKIDLHLDLARLGGEYGGAVTGGFTDDRVRNALVRSFEVAWIVALICGARAILVRRHGARELTAWDVGVTIVPLGCALVFAALFVTLPLWIGNWWYVYPREATAATLVLLASCPDLPRAPLLRAALVAAMCAGGIVVAREVKARYAEFAPPSEDLYTITRRLPRAPKLFYMIVDHSGTTRSNSPFIHLPAYVQAEKGGWLSWHFAVWNASPVEFRPRDQPGAVVTPKTPPRWEWSPFKYKLEMTTFFDWFLIRDKASPDHLFKGDPTIKRVDHVGSWWLYQRTGPKK